jgi:hypothetical protein
VIVGFGVARVVLMLTHTNTPAHTLISGATVDALDGWRVTQLVSAVSCAFVLLELEL